MISRFEADLIDALIDDFYGVWEFDWRLNSLGFSDDRKLRIEVLSNLINNDYVNVYFGRIGDRSISPMSKDDALKFISNLENWKPRTNIAEHILFLSATDKADSELR